MAASDSLKNQQNAWDFIERNSYPESILTLISSGSITELKHGTND